MDKELYEIKLLSYKKVDKKWVEQDERIFKFNHFIKAQAFYKNVINDELFKARNEYGFSTYGNISRRTFWSPSGLFKSVYIF